MDAFCLRYVLGLITLLKQNFVVVFETFFGPRIETLKLAYSPPPPRKHTRVCTPFKVFELQVKTSWTAAFGTLGR